jgi:two-component system response regulator GlrR
VTKLLIVEDDEIVLRGLEMLLVTAGHEVQAVSSGEAALEALAVGAALPDLIIADLLMPGMDGLELIDTVRAQSQWRSLPFLLITAQDAQRISKQITEREEVALLGKPFDVEALRSAMAEVLDEQSRSSC